MNDPKIRPAKPIAVIALGNDLLGDDGVALVAARELRRNLPDGVEIIESPTGGFALLDCLEGRERVLLIDAVMTGKVEAGTIVRIDPATLPVGEVPLSPHYAGITDCLQLAECLDLPCPTDIVILAMEVSDPFRFSTSFSPAVAQALPAFVQAARDVIDQFVQCHVAGR